MLAIQRRPPEVVCQRESSICPHDSSKTACDGIRDVNSHARRTFLINLNWKFNETRSKYRGSGAGEKQKARM